MRRARRHELKERAVPVMTARLSETELAEWLPLRFDDIDDPLGTPEPSKGALIKLETGAYVVVFYGQESKQLTLEISETAGDVSEVVAAFLDEVPLPVSRIVWRRPDTKLPPPRRREANGDVSVIPGRTRPKHFGRREATVAEDQTETDAIERLNRRKKSPPLSSSERAYEQLRNTGVLKTARDFAAELQISVAQVRNIQRRLARRKLNGRAKRK